MKATLLLTTTLLAGSLLSVQAEPKDELKKAIEKLGEKGNYSWTSNTERPEREGDQERNNRFRGGATTGKTKDGMIMLSMTRGERTFESLRKGEKVAFKREGEWAVMEPRGGGDGEGGDRRRRGGRGFGGGAAAPDAQALELLEDVAELKKDGDAYMGSLKEEAAKSMVSFGRGRRGGADQATDRPEPKDLKVTAKFWVKDGMLAKYETSISGSITYNENERDLSRTSTVEIKEVGETKIDVPEDIKKKLAAE